MANKGIFIVLLALLGACGSKLRSPGTISEECAVKKVSMWRSGLDTPLFKITENVWYHDSIGISQICSISTFDSGSITVTKVVTNGFRYFDLRNKWIYEYQHFSDTALPLRQFIGSDTSTLSGGWNFLRATPPTADTLIRLADTVIANSVHQKYRLVFTTNGHNFSAIALFRCDISSTVFTIDPVLRQRLGCPMVGIHIETAGTNDIGSATEIMVTANKFPDSVRKVFTAWIENEKRYPIQ